MKKLLLLAVLLLPSTARAGEHCHEVSDTVGERRCTRFGQFWSTERSIPMFGAVGAWSSVLSPRGLEHRIEQDAQSGASRRVDAASFIRGPMRTYGFDLRMGGVFARYGYVALDFGAAFGHASSNAYTTDGYTLSAASGTNLFLMRAAPVFGARIPLGRVSLRVEGVTGVQLLVLMANARTESGGVVPAGATRLGGIIEPRIAADLWLTPDTTLSAWTGSNILRPGDYTFGLSLAAHLRAFDGAF